MHYHNVAYGTPMSEYTLLDLALKGGSHSLMATQIKGTLKTRNTLIALCALTVLAGSVLFIAGQSGRVHGLYGSLFRAVKITGFVLGAVSCFFHYKVRQAQTKKLSFQEVHEWGRKNAIYMEALIKERGEAEAYAQSLIAEYSSETKALQEAQNNFDQFVQAPFGFPRQNL